MASLRFSDIDIESLFGHEAAEDELPSRLREYYFKSATYDQVVTGAPLRILVGHKGIGKSALFKVAIAEQQESNRLAIEVRPDDIAEIATGQTEFLTSIRAWKVGLKNLVARKAAVALGLNVEDVVKHVDTSGSITRALGAIISASVIPRSPDQMLMIDNFVNDSVVTVYMDDLDRGWEGRKSDVTRISALLNAVRDLINEDRGVRFRISMRSDVYFLVRTSDESTDKVEGSVVWQSWNNHDVFALLVKRVETYFGRQPDYEKLRDRSQRELAAYLSPVMDDTFRGRGHWANAPIHRVLMSLIRNRPRDLVKLCSLAGRNAQSSKASKIFTDNFEAIFEEYSQGRIQDTINEYRSELPDIDRLILNMRPSIKEKTAKAGYVYNTADLLSKIGNIQEQGQFRFKAGRVASARDLAAFMYKINFLTARKEQPDGIVRKYFEEQRYLQSEFVEFGFSWEVHPAYRWALQPDDPFSIFNTLRLSSDLS